MRLSKTFGIVVIILGTLMLFMSCQRNYKNEVRLKWNRDFMNGKITVETVKEKVPVGSSYDDLQEYIKKHKIPSKHPVFEVGYLRGNQSDFYEYYLPEDILAKASYSIELHGHIYVKNYPFAYHNYIAFVFDENDTVLFIFDRNSLKY